MAKRWESWAWAASAGRYRTVENNASAINMEGFVLPDIRPPSARRAWAINGRQLVSQHAA